MAEQNKNLAEGVSAAKGVGGGAAWAPVLGSVASSLLGGAANIVLQQRQRAYDKEMWNLQNEYNSPAAQVRRLRAAGLNPGLNDSVGTGNNESSAGGQNPASVDFSPIAQGMRDSVDLYQQKRMQDAQIDWQNQNTYNLAIRNRYENTRQILELDKLLADKHLADSTRRFYEQERERLIKENSWIDQRNSSQVALNDAQAGQARAAEVESQTRTDFQKIVNLYAPESQRQIMQNLMASYAEIMSAAANNNASAANQKAMEALNRASEQLTKTHGEGAKIDNQTKRKIQAAVVKEAFAKANEASSAAQVAAKGAKGGTLWTKFIGYGNDSNVNNYIQRHSAPSKSRSGVR